MLWFKSWAIGFVISSIVTSAALVVHRPFGVLTDYIEAPLLPGFLMLQAFPSNGPPVGMIFLIIVGIPPILSGGLVYGFIVYLILRLQKNGEEETKSDQNCKAKPGNAVRSSRRDKRLRYSAGGVFGHPNRR